jgi:DNA-directed RNA polymerase subunit D
MELEILKEGGSRLSLKIRNLPLPALNAIRRYSMNSIPVLAIDSISLYENSSPIFDEYIAHRIGLIPIKTPKRLPASTEVFFTLDEQGPKEVCSGDLKSSDAGIQVAEPRIPIITLGEDQSIRLEGKAIVATARKHAKFQAGIAAYEVADDGSFTLKAESFLSMEPRDMLLRGCTILADDLDSLSDALDVATGKKKPKKAAAKKAPAKKAAKKPAKKKAKSSSKKKKKEE